MIGALKTKRNVARMSSRRLEQILRDENHPLFGLAEAEVERRLDEASMRPLDEPEDTPCLDPPWWAYR